MAKPMLGIVIAAAWLASCGAKKEVEAEPVVTVDVAPVLLSRIQRTIRADGLLYPRQQAAIAPKVSAPVKKVYVQRGARVRTGQLLLDLAEATFETTAKATVPQELQKAELDARAAKEAFDAQQSVFENRQRLYREGAIAQKDVNDAQVVLSQARSQYETTRKRFEDLQSFDRDQQLKAAAAQRNAAKGKSDTAQAQLSYARIVSPIDGVVTDLPLYAGETAQSGAPVVTIMDVSRVIARSHVPQSEAAELTVGNEANLIGPAGVPIPGKVTLINAALDAASSTVEVWVEAENPDGKLRPGSSIRVEMIAKTVPNALVIPQNAVLTSPTGATFAIVIDNESKPHLRKIAIGIRDKGLVQISDGLQSGQRVATTGAFELFKLDPEVLAKTKVQIAPAKEEEEPEES
jgi:HlyD family secretion protein